MKRIIYILTVLSGLYFASCNDKFLDKMPDNRTELKTPEQITQLLVDGYSTANYAVLGELSSDNVVDNNAPDAVGNRYNVTPWNKIDDEIFAWDDAVSDNQQDSPTDVWEGAYHAIAVANAALEAIETLKSQGVDSTKLSAAKGEALLIRAYHHFILVNIFSMAYRNDALSAQDPGIPYITKPETKVIEIAERNSVTDVYRNIEKDLLEGLPLIDDTNYDIPKYHFNKQAAYAFAARFYLFKRNYDKVIEYANLALGPNPATLMRSWNVAYPTATAEMYGQIDAKLNCNFMLIPTLSWLERVYSAGPRYTINGDAANGTIFGKGPTWNNYNYHPCYSGRLYISNQGQMLGVFFLAACGEIFEYTDKIAGIGYGHIVRTEFTAEETLLCRAEAYIFKNMLPNALVDLKIWDDARKDLPIPRTFLVLTDSLIQTFYNPTRTLFVKQLNTEKMDPEWKIASDTTNRYLQCLLHFRRLETISSGMRWFDIKRFGIEITHKIGTTRVETLVWNDPRRALQLPVEVIAAGMDPNVRMELPPDNSAILSSTPCEIESN